MKNVKLFKDHFITSIIGSFIHLATKLVGDKDVVNSRLKLIVSVNEYKRELN